MINEFIDFVKFERRYGLKVLFNDLVAINKLYFQKIYLKRILDFADDNNLKFTFFIRAKNLKKRRIIHELLDKGHEIGSHGYNHLLLGEKPYSKILQEFKKADKEFKSIGIRPQGFRPPFLSCNKDVINIAKQFGFKYISGGNKPFKYGNRLIEIPIIRPYDWEALIVDKLSFDQMIKEWNNKKGTYLLHPWLATNYLRKLGLVKNKDYRIISNLGKNKISVSFDVY